jgi:hypothetical protein
MRHCAAVCGGRNLIQCRAVASWSAASASPARTSAALSRDLSRVPRPLAFALPGRGFQRSLAPASKTEMLPSAGLTLLFSLRPSGAALLLNISQVAMRVLSLLWKGMTADWRPRLCVTVPLFVAALGYGIYNGVEQVVSLALVLFLASWHVSEYAVLSYRRLCGVRGRTGRRRQL